MFGVKEEDGDPAGSINNVDQLNEFLRRRMAKTGETAREVLKVLLADTDVQKWLAKSGLVLTLNADETEFVVYQDPQKPPPVAPPPPIPLVLNPGKPNTSTLGFGGLRVDINSHAMRVALFFHQAVVKFATTVAGKLSGGPVTAILETGFEDILNLSRKAVATQADLRVAAALPTPDVQGGPTFDPANWQTTFSEKELQVLEQLRGMTQALNNSQTALAVYSALKTQSAADQYLYEEWLTLPINLANSYFKPYVQSGIDDALSQIAPKVNIPRRALFYTLINSDARTPFAKLVALIIKQDQATRANTATTGNQFQEIQRLMQEARIAVQNSSFEVEQLVDNQEDPAERQISNYQPAQRMNTTLPPRQSALVRRSRDFAFI